MQEAVLQNQTIEKETPTKKQTKAGKQTKSWIETSYHPMSIHHVITH